MTHFTSTTRMLQCVLQSCANKGYWSLILSGNASLRTADAFPVVASFDDRKCVCCSQATKMSDLNKNAKTKCILVVVVKCRDRENGQLAV